MVWLLLALGLALVVASGLRAVALLRLPQQERRAGDPVGVALALAGVLVLWLSGRVG